MVAQPKQKTCTELISARCYDRKKQFEDAWIYFKDKDEGFKRKSKEFDDYSSLMDYANQSSLDFSYVEPNTFKKQSEGQEEAIENDLMREEHKSMPINVDRQSRVTFGGTKKS